MIRSIKQQLYLIGLLPLAALALVVVLFNGYSRIQDAERQLREAQSLTVELLQNPATDALIVGNIKFFQDQMNAVVARSTRVQCLALWDTHNTLIARGGRCDQSSSKTDLFSIEASPAGFADLDTPAPVSVIGTLRVSLSRAPVIAEQRAVVWQALVSLLLVGGVGFLVARFLRSRLVGPIQAIDATMKAVGQGHYAARTVNESDDELGRLAGAINAAIATIQRNVVEIERRRDDAVVALNYADAVTLARNGLVEALVTDLGKPLGTLHEQLTEIAVNNQNADQRNPIREAMRRLQELQKQFRELIEIATSPHSQLTPARHSMPLGQLLTSVEQSIRAAGETDHFRVQFVAPLVSGAGGLNVGPDRLLVTLDVERLQKVLVRLTHTLARRCTPDGVYLHAQVARRSATMLNITLHLKAFLGPLESQGSSDILQYSSATPAALQWSERDRREIEYLLGILRAAPSYSVSPSGTVNIMVDIDCDCIDTETPGVSTTERLMGRKPLVMAVVSSDPSLQSLTTRGGLVNHDLHLHDLDQALESHRDFVGYDIVLIDLADDVAGAHTLATQLMQLAGTAPQLIAICPPGQLSSLGQQLQRIGFAALVQKPVNYARLLDLLPRTLQNPLQTIRRTGDE